MASIRERPHKDGSTAYAVLYTINGRQTSATFADRKHAEVFSQMVEVHGASRAMEMAGLSETVRAQRAAPGGMTVAQFLAHHIDHLTGVQKATIHNYRLYLENDIKPAAIGAIP